MRIGADPRSGDWEDVVAKLPMLVKLPLITEITGLSASALKVEIHAGRLPACKLQRRANAKWLVPKAEFLDWLRNLPRAGE